MRDERAGGTAMIAAALMGLVTMAFHPNGHDVTSDVAFQGAVALAVHALALTAVPIALYGAVTLSRRLAAGGAMTELALSFYGMALIATILATSASGLLAPGLIAHMLTLQGDARTASEAVLYYNGSVNQAFARLLVAASSIAFALWSLVILRTGLLRRAAGITGLIVATLAVAALLAGLRLDVHGFGMIVVLQAVWLIMVGLELRRTAIVAPS